MPFQIIKTNDNKYKLFNLHKQTYAKPTFKTKQSAINSGLNYMRYRHETGVVKGNKILKK